MYAGDIDDVSAATKDHCLQGIATAEESALEIDIDDAVPIGFVHFQRRLYKVHAGIVDQRVDLTAGGQGFVYEPFAVSSFGNICIDEQPLAIARLQIGCDLRAQPLVDIGYHNLRPRFSEAFGDAGANPAGCAGDDGDMSVPVH